MDGGSHGKENSKIIHEAILKVIFKGYHAEVLGDIVKAILGDFVEELLEAFINKTLETFLNKKFWFFK